MQNCWNDDKDSRPTFLKLKEVFDGLMSYEERYNYLILNGEMAQDVESAPQPTDYIEPTPNVGGGVAPTTQTTEGSDSGQEVVVTIVESMLK